MATATATTPSTTAPAANKTTLFVSDLPKDVEDIENTLYRHFGQVGSIVSTKACRDMHTQRLLGHGYVNFQNQADAEKALKQLAFSEIVPGKPIRVSWSQRDPASRKMGTGNLFIKDLEDSVTPRMLFEAFSAIGQVASCKLSLDDTGKSRHYGFVHFDNPANSDKAIELSDKDQLTVGGKAVKVEFFKKRVEREKEQQDTFTNMYVKNLSPECKLDKLLKVLNSFESEPLKNEPFLHLQTPFNTQYALVEMNSHEGAMKAIEALHEKDHELAAKDSTLYVARAQTKKERAAAKTLATQQALIQNQGKNLYVKHLDDTMTDETLAQLFNPYGAIASCAVARFPDSGASKGYGFVVFEQKEAAANAQRELHNKVIGTRPLYVAVAQNRDARIKMLEQQSRNRVQAAAMGGAPGGAPGAPGGMPPGAGAGMMYGMPGNYPGSFGGAGYGGRGGRGGGGAMPPANMNLPRPPMGPRGMPGMPPNGMPPGMPPMMGPNGMPMGGRGGFPGQFGGMPGAMPPYGFPGQQQGGYNNNRGPRGPRHNNNQNNNNNNQNSGNNNQQGAGSNNNQAGGSNNNASASGNNTSATAGLPSLQELSKMTPEEQKNTLGERLFVQVQTIHQPQAAKITGMLLEMDVSEIIHIIENESVLRAKVNEALAVLRDYGVSTQN